ncbi:MAG: flavodoxin-dependent (E)-4-hydroxy-3-methylbut-2-enyl-diphosphate synthase [Planctomycetota bacterium]|jgi:(E)-4-hydroxy-3-methylbut-2-enyl-diphosphate synthase
MIKRRKTINFRIGSVKIGSNAPIIIQSMTKVPTVDISRCIKQIKALQRCGCQLVRIAVANRKDSSAFKRIAEKVNVPLIADIHFSSARAIESIEAGAAKIRLNPGNIKRGRDILRIIDSAKMHDVAIRIGVNEASIRDLKKKNVPLQKRTDLMLREMKKYVRLFEGCSFRKIVLSAKSSDPVRTIEINRKIADAFDYPIHLGLTHAGLIEDAQMSSAVTLGALLAEGIGDTIRVSAAGNPVFEVEIAKKILSCLGLYKLNEPELIVCPTCARAQIDVTKPARKVKKALLKVNKPIRVAVMGCIVNGPGEAADADLAICAAKGKAFLYRKGKKIATVSETKLENTIVKELQKL